MELTFARDGAALDARLDAFLAERLERNIAATLLAQIRSGRLSPAGGLFAWATIPAGAIEFFAMRTPPWPLLVTELQPQRAEQLVERWLAEDPMLPGVSAVPDTAQAVARAWQRTTGGRWGGRRDALHALREVIEPPWPAGDLRTAVADDRDLLVTWERAFVAEAGRRSSSNKRKT